MKDNTIMFTSNEKGEPVQRIECAGCGKTFDHSMMSEASGGEPPHRICPNCTYDHQTDMFLSKEDNGRSLHIALANLVIAVDGLLPYAASSTGGAAVFSTAVADAQRVLDQSRHQYGYWPPVPVASDEW